MVVYCIGKKTKNRFITIAVVYKVYNGMVENCRMRQCIPQGCVCSRVKKKKKK